VRQKRGAFLPPVRAARARRGDLYHTLRAAVLDGVLPAGERLPSTRQAATDYGVSRGLLEEVFGQLTEEGFLERAVGRGTFVASRVARLGISAKVKGGERRLPSPSRRGLMVAADAACREPAHYVPFNAGVADTSEFSWKVWYRMQARAARELGPSGLRFADPRGLPDLRIAIARYLAQFRGISCTPGEVVVFNSAQQALNALFIVLLDRGEAVWVEDPCYLGARAAVELAGAAMIPVPVDDEGIRVDIATRRSPYARLAYVTPSHQYPTGAILSLERRIALLDWATRNGSWVVEDDYDGEFGCKEQQLTALHSLDSQGHVLYVGTLNKSMFVSLRLAYAVVPEQLVEVLANIRTQLDGFTPAVTQMAMSFFMDEGYFSSHLRRMRAVYGAKRAALVDGLAPLAARGWTWSNRPAGIHLLMRHQRGKLVRSVAKASSLDLALVSSYRVVPAKDDGLFLRYGSLDMASLQAGVASLVATVNRVSH
jgi:GntR family transcriptional regulator / MocR family aminotransferase